MALCNKCHLKLGVGLDEGEALLDGTLGLALDAVDQHVACGDVVDEADDLAGGPDLEREETVSEKNKRHQTCVCFLGGDLYVHRTRGRR